MADLPEVERALQLKTIRDAGARGLFLSAIREFGKEGGPFTLERLDALMRVEEHFQALLLYDQIEFLRQPASAMEPERDFALNVQRICLDAANGFQRYLRTRSSWATSRDALDRMFRVTGLALNCVHCFVKWGYFIGEPGRAAPWRQMHALYLLAESDAYSQVPFVLHPSQPSFKPSVQSLYLRTLLLDLLNTGNLTRIQVEVADGWFASWCRDYSLDTEYSSRQHLFYVDLSSESGLHIMRKDSVGETVRYVRADNLKSQIEEVQSGLRQGRLFAGHGAGAVFPVEQHVALLAIIEKLYRSIVAGSENRIEERTHFEDREVDVAVGMDRLMRKARNETATHAAPTAAAAAALMETIEISPSGMALVEAAPDLQVEPSTVDPDVERWRVYDLSSRGFGLLVDRAASESVLLNGILGLRKQDGNAWICGTIVRKMPSRSRGEVLVGVEVLCYRAIPVDLAPASGGPALPALYLPGGDTNGKQDSLLMRVGDFRAGLAFGIRLGPSVYHVRLNRVIRKGADWIKARFEIVSKA